MTGVLSEQIVLFSLILMRMSGFILLNPILGRKGLPQMAKAGMIMALTVVIFPGAEMGTVMPQMTLEFLFWLLKEFSIGYLLGFVVELFSYVVTMAGTVIDFMMGLSMATVYDPQSGTQMALTGSVLNIFYMLLFFVSDGHLVLMKILMTSAKVVPYGGIVFGTDLWNAMLQIFLQCTLLAVKMTFPLLAIEFLTEMGIGILMKIVPQINLFVLSIQLKVLLGLAVLMILIGPIGDYLSNITTQMFNTMQEILRMTAG